MLAPMADLTHPAFRELVASFGGCDLFFTEMININYLKSTNPLKDPYVVPAERDRPLVAQLVGGKPEDFELAVERLEATGFFSGYNFNLGCTKGKFQRYGWGASLLEKPELIRDILKAMRRATDKPLSVKMRIPKGRNKDRLLRLLEVFESLGVDFVVLHPRTPEEGFSRPARWEEITFAVEASSLKIVANGDVFSPEDAAKVIDSTGAWGIMVGRAALIRPWILRDIGSYLEKGEVDKPPDAICVLEALAGYIKRFLPERWHIKRLKLFLRWFVQNYTNALWILRRLKGRSLEELLEVSKRELKGLKMRGYPVNPFLFVC